MTRLPLIEARVVRRTAVATGICAFELASARGGPLPTFEAGAHIDLHVGGFVRQYSLLNAPCKDPAHYEIAVLRTTDSRGGSAAVHAHIQEGTHVSISGPRNNFPLRAGSTHSVLVAGGIGITPMLSMAASLHARGSPFVLHYCARSEEQMAFHNELLRSTFAASVRLHFDDRKETGIDWLAMLSRYRAYADLYVCGPAGFMDHVLTLARGAGWGESRLHHESFQPASPVVSRDRQFDLLAARSGKRITVGAGETALQALMRCQVDVTASCEQGVCGTCLTPVLNGVVDHRDSFLTTQEKSQHDQFLPCCSRALSDVLTIDI